MSEEHRIPREGTDELYWITDEQLKVLRKMLSIGSSDSDGSSKFPKALIDKVHNEQRIDFMERGST